MSDQLPGVKFSRCLFAAALAFQTLFYLTKLTSPWVDQNDFNGAVWSQAGHNLLTGGWATNAGMPAPFYFGAPPIPRDELYVHHPALLAWLVAAAFKIFGEHEWAARGIPIFCSSVNLLLIWRLAKNNAGEGAAACSAAIFASLPMQLCYGQMVNFEPVTLTAALGAFLSWSHWEASGERRWKWFAAAAFGVTMLTAWTGFMIVLTFCISQFICRWKINGKFAMGLLGLAVIIGGLFLVQISWARPDAFADAMDSLWWRMGQSSGNGNFTLGQWAIRVARSLAHFVPVWSWVFAAVGVWTVTARQPGSPNAKSLVWIALCFFVMSLSYIVIFRNASYIHDYASFYFIVPVALLGGAGLQAVVGFARKYSNRTLATAALLAILLLLGIEGWRSSRSLTVPEEILTLAGNEPRNLIPELGRLIQNEFPPDADLICNFDLCYSPQLRYYARHDIINGLVDVDDWQTYIEAEHPAGGIIWMGAPGAGSLIASSESGTTHLVTVQGIQFAIWHARS